MTGRVSAFLNYKVGFGRKPENFFKIFWWFFLIAAIGTSAINAFYWFCQWLVKKNSLSFLLKYFFGAVRFSCVATLWILFPLFSLVGRFKTVAGRGDKVLSLNSRANYSSNLMFSCFLSILFFVLQALADAMASKFQIFRPRHGNVFGWGKWIHNLPYDPIAPPMPRPCLN